MSRDSTPMRITERSHFGPSVEWYELPIVGEATVSRRSVKVWVAAALVSAMIAGFLLIR